MVFSFFVTSFAMAADSVVKHVEFNPKKNAYTVEVEGGSPQSFDFSQLVIKLDAGTKTPVLHQGTHLYYVIFPNFAAMAKATSDMKP